MFSGSKYAGFGANDAPAECSMPWSTGRIDTYPVPASRPVPSSDCRLTITRAGRSEPHKHAFDEIRSRQVQRLARNRPALMREKTCIVAKD